MTRFSSLLLLFTACEPATNARQATVVQALVRADEVTIRARPNLMAGKFERMAAEPYDFFRGAVPLARLDWENGRTSQSNFDLDTKPVFGLGDPHPENFGLLTGEDGRLALQPNDFDAADRVPALFDLRRLVVGLAVGARRCKPATDVTAVSRAAAQAYATHFLALSRGELEPLTITQAPDVPVIADLFRRGTRDQLSRAELEQLTEQTAEGRRFRRGIIDPAEPSETLSDVAPELVPSLEVVFAPLQREVLDVVRQHGSGIASWPRVRFLALLAGETPNDEWIIELKELSESPLAGWYRPVLVADDVPSRVRRALAVGWGPAFHEPVWSTSSWLEMPVQLRLESEAHKGVRVENWAGSLGSTESLTRFGEVLGRLLAQAHHRDADARDSLVRQLGRDPAAFADEQAAFATAEVEQVFADFEAFRSARETLGQWLGVQVEVRDQPAGAAAVLFDLPR